MRKLRIFLFQLLCVLGQWERALNQLNVASGLDPSALAMAQTYGDAVRCEAVRDDVFDGQEIADDLRPARPVAGAADRVAAGRRPRRAPSDRRSCEPGPSTKRRHRAATSTAGRSSGSPTPIRGSGPVLEAVINGRYYWVPFSRLTKIEIEPPEDLRDLVWMPAHLQFENGGESVALIPTRYPGSETSPDGLIALARKTVWEEIGAGRAPRSRSAHPRHRYRRRAPDGGPHDHARRQRRGDEPDPAEDHG